MAASWFPLFGRDFLAATTGWTAEERGHYVTLLIVQWEQDGLPDDLKRLELISPGLKGCWKTIADKFPVWKDGKRRNTRLEHERAKANDRSERARQSASQRWAGAMPSGDSAANPKPPNPEPGQCERICDRICDGMSGGICSDDASITILNSPPPPAGSDGHGAAWAALREAWNTGAKQGRREEWISSQPPPKMADRLAEPGWLDEAIKAIGMTAGLLAFDHPVTLGQFAQPGWVAKVLGGYWREKRKPKPARAGDQPADRPSAAEAAAAWQRAAADPEAARRRQEFLDARKRKGGGDAATEAARSAAMKALEAAG